MKDIDWNQVGIGIALSMGQVWAVQNLAASSIINFAVFLHSPLLFVMATIGAIIGTLIGVAFLPAESLWEGKLISNFRNNQLYITYAKFSE